jgi:hypothetical protein
MAKVWVTYDSLLEKVICVHDVPDCLCEDCKPIFRERDAEKNLYQLEEHEFEVKKYKKDNLEEV